MHLYVHMALLAEYRRGDITWDWYQHMSQLLNEAAKAAEKAGWI